MSAAPYEPHGAITIAAMACGTPVGGARSAANRDAVLDETTGPARGARAGSDLLARRVRRLLATPMRLEAFGIAAADRASSRYSWDRIGRETAAAYDRCLPSAIPDIAAPETEDREEELALERAGQLAVALA